MSDAAAAVTVVGSANLDLILHTPHLPVPGETVSTTAVRRGPGGKGLNQAVAAARSGAAVRFVGAVGRDDAADLLLEHLRTNGVNTDHVARVDGPSGGAVVMVDASGENAILVTSGANGVVAMPDADPGQWLDGAVLLLQLEIPADVVLQWAAAARARKVLVILNAAPVAPLTDELLANVDLLVVNESECMAATGMGSLAAAAERLAQQVRLLVVTRGADGAMWFRDGALDGEALPPTVSPVDTTGAGDTFCGALAARLADGDSLADALAFALVAGALSTQTPGADSAPPSDVVATMVSGRGSRRA